MVRPFGNHRARRYGVQRVRHQSRSVQCITTDRVLKAYMGVEVHLHTFLNQTIDMVAESTNVNNQHGSAFSWCVCVCVCVCVCSVWLLDVSECTAGVRFYWQHSIPGTQQTIIVTKLPLCTEPRTFVFNDKVYKNCVQLFNNSPQFNETLSCLFPTTYAHSIFNNTFLWV
jgi:hypothetical protein